MLDVGYWMSECGFRMQMTRDEGIFTDFGFQKDPLCPSDISPKGENLKKTDFGNIGIWSR